MMSNENCTQLSIQKFTKLMAHHRIPPTFGVCVLYFSSKQTLILSYSRIRWKLKLFPTHTCTQYILASSFTFSLSLSLPSLSLLFYSSYQAGRGGAGETARVPLCRPISPLSLSLSRLSAASSRRPRDFRRRPASTHWGKRSFSHFSRFIFPYLLALRFVLAAVLAHGGRSSVAFLVCSLLLLLLSRLLAFYKRE